MKTLIITTAIAFIMLSSSGKSATANLSSRYEIFNTNAMETYYLLDEVNEKPLMVEEWMKNTHYFDFYLLEEYKEQEINVEKWMYNTDYFYSLNQYSEKNNSIIIESWMTDPGYFYHPGPESGQEKAILIEEWMLDINYFFSDNYAEKNDPENKLKNGTINS